MQCDSLWPAGRRALVCTSCLTYSNSVTFSIQQPAPGKAIRLDIGCDTLCSSRLSSVSALRFALSPIMFEVRPHSLLGNRTPKEYALATVGL
jgi:hypothetical protein